MGLRIKTKVAWGSSDWILSNFDLSRNMVWSAISTLLPLSTVLSTYNPNHIGSTYCNLCNRFDGFISNRLVLMDRRTSNRLHVITIITKGFRLKDRLWITFYFVIDRQQINKVSVCMSGLCWRRYALRIIYKTTCS